jgi:hypothetical protein
MFSLSLDDQTPHTNHMPQFYPGDTEEDGYYYEELLEV